MPAPQELLVLSWPHSLYQIRFGAQWMPASRQGACIIFSNAWNQDFKKNAWDPERWTERDVLPRSFPILALEIPVLEGALIKKNQVFCFVSTLSHPDPKVDTLCLVLSEEDPGDDLTRVTHLFQKTTYGWLVGVTLKPQEDVLTKLVQIAIGLVCYEVSDNVLLLLGPRARPASPLVACDAKVSVPLLHYPPGGPLTALAYLTKLFGKCLGTATVIEALVYDQMPWSRWDEDASSHCLVGQPTREGGGSRILNFQLGGKIDSGQMLHPTGVGKRLRTGFASASRFFPANSNAISFSSKLEVPRCEWSKSSGTTKN